jgi:glycosyltransferase involved in cell wall biosynthesis
MRMSRLLIRSHTALRTQDLPGGATRLMVNIASALRTGGWDVEFLCPTPRGAPGETNGMVFNEFDYHTPESSVSKVANSVRGWRTFFDLVREREFDIVLDDVSPTPFYPAHFLGPERTVNAVFLHTAYFGAARQFSGTIGGSIVDVIGRTLPYLNAPEIVCAGPSTERRIRDVLGYRKTHVLKPCVDVDQFGYRFDPEAKHILFLGRLTTRKNLACLLDAWSAVEREHDEYTLTVAGDGPLRPQLERKSMELGLENVVFAGFVSEARKRDLFERSLLYVLPSLMEGYPTTGLEALAAGTPVVGANTYGVSDYVVDGENGYLFENDDSDDLAELLVGLLDRPADLEGVAIQGRRSAERHSSAVFERRARDLFAELVS